jgi:hypothetical protein
MKKAWLGLVAVGLMGASAYAGVVDIIFVVDESGSMGGEQAWLGTMVSSLDSGIVASGNTAQYGLVGFGASGSGGHTVAGHAHTVGGGQFGTAAQFATAASGLVLTGGTEDGWDGIDEALAYSFGAGHAVQIILVTDEDRDNVNGALTYANMVASLAGKSAVLNAVVNANYRNATTTGGIGVASSGNIYFADGSGGFTTAAGGYATAASGGGTTINDYVNMAWATGGAGWDLNILRLGGNNAASFTKAFVDIKVQEIVQQLVPLPSAAWAGLSLLGVLGVMRTRRRKTIELS